MKFQLLSGGVEVSGCWMAARERVQQVEGNESLISSWEDRENLQIMFLIVPSLVYEGTQHFLVCSKVQIGTATGFRGCCQ